jgi:hypothetical protein
MSYTGFKKQTSTRDSYTPDQACGFGLCSIGTTTQLPCNKTGGIEDETTAWEDCVGGFCPRRRVCVPPDRKECDVGLNDGLIDPLSGVDWQVKAPNLVCKYDIDEMNSINVIDNYKRLFGDNDNYKLMMERLCGGEATLCALDPLSGKPFEKCSNINSTTQVGDECRLFYNTQTAEIKDTIVQNYCVKHPNNPDCKCVERATDPNYRNVKPHIPFNDGCWYPACATAPYLKTQDVKNATCPSDVCQIVFDNLNNNNVNISDNKNAINCKFEAPPQPPPPRPSPGPSPLPRPNPAPSSPVNITAVVIIGIAVFVVVIALIAAGAGQRQR